MEHDQKFWNMFTDWINEISEIGITFKENEVIFWWGMYYELACEM